MKNLALTFLFLLAAACSTTEPEPSLGDEFIHEVKCPNFMKWKMCVDRAQRLNCNGDEIRVLSPSIEELDNAEKRTARSVPTAGTTIPVEGTIRHRYIVVECLLSE